MNLGEKYLESQGCSDIIISGIQDDRKRKKLMMNPSKIRFNSYWRTNDNDVRTIYVAHSYSKILLRVSFDTEGGKPSHLTSLK